MLSRIKKFVRKYLTVRVVSSVKTPVYRDHLLEGKKAVVVGAGGIGKAIAAAFLANGCEVTVTGTNREKLDRICQSLNNENVRCVVLDVTETKSIQRIIWDAADQMGGLDIFVYAAGIHGHDVFGSVTEETWDSVLDINLKGMYFADQAAANYMKKHEIKGHILNVSSASCNKPGWTPYEISKNGVKALTLGFADKLIPFGIVVNSIAPGPVATQMLGVTQENLAWEGNPSGRVATPEEIANIALVMASDMGNLIVGDTFFVSGGSGTVCLDK